MLRLLSLLSISLLVLVGGCLKPDAVGSHHEIVVVVSPLTWDQYEVLIRSIFERTIMTPQEEPIFTLRVVDPEDFDFYRKFKNVLILSPLRGEGPAVSLVNSLISEQAKAQVLSNRTYLFQKRDIWAREQTLTILTGRDEISLEAHLTEKSDEIFGIMETDLNRKVKAWLYEKMEQKKLEEKLLKSYGWSIRVPRDYWVDRELPNERFVFFRKSVPDRWLFVYWENTHSFNTVTAEWCLRKRTEIGTIHYGGDTMVEEYTRVERETFLEWEAHRIVGLWQNDTPESGFAAGGPFCSYCFYDDDTDRAYMIDIAVFAPGMAKEPYLRQLDIIAHTFHREIGRHRGEPSS